AHQKKAQRAPQPPALHRRQTHRLCRVKPDVLGLGGADEHHEGGISGAIVAKIVDPARRIEDRVTRTEGFFGRMPGVLPAHGNAAFQHEICILLRARIAAHRRTLRQKNLIHAILAGRRATLADQNGSGETGFPYRPLRSVAHDMSGELPLTRVIAMLVKGAGFPGARAKTAGSRRVVVAWVANIDRRLWHPAADTDRNQHRPRPLVSKSIPPPPLVPHHCPWARARPDY